MGEIYDSDFLSFPSQGKLTYYLWNSQLLTTKYTPPSGVFIAERWIDSVGDVVKHVIYMQKVRNEICIKFSGARNVSEQPKQCCVCH